MVDGRRLEALVHNGSYRAHNRHAVKDVTGREYAELSMLPPLFVERALSALRAARPLPAAERLERITAAAALFRDAPLLGLSAADYRDAVCRVGGIPITEVRRAVRTLAERLPLLRANLDGARPAGAADGWRASSARGGGAVWARRGATLAVQAAGNHPGPHGIWPEALALGFRVAVRPSTREPFTAHRLVAALRAAGFGPDHVVYLPTDHAGADELIRGADLGLVYGGDDAVRKHAADPRVLTQGPGRSKILLTADVDWRAHLDLIVDSVAAHGGTGCVNTTAVLVEGDAAELGEALAERLSRLPALSPADPGAVLPVQPIEVASRFAKTVAAHAVGARPWLGADRIAADLGDGSAALRPAVHQLGSATDRRTRVELPFPCVWVAPWTPKDGAAALSGSLVLTALTEREELIDAFVDDASIGNVYLGNCPTHHMAPGLPHDGFLADFLMRTKAFVRR